MTSPSPGDTLRRFAFFDGFADVDVAALAAAMASATFDEDRSLFREGDPRRLFAIVEAGSVAIEQSTGGRAVRLATLGPGEPVGEGILLEDDEPHGTTARTLERTTLLYWSLFDLRALLHERPALFAQLVTRAARLISARLRSADATLAGHRRLLGFGGGRRRVEHDDAGAREVPDEALYGIETARALEEPPISGVPLRDYPELVAALAAVKEAAAVANAEYGLLDTAVRDAIVHAAREVRAGRHHEHFLVDMMQGGGGTLADRNAAEVLANRALELLGRPHGDYARVDPRRDVNRSLGAAAAYAAAVKLAMHAATLTFQSALQALADAYALRSGALAACAPVLREDARRLGETVAMLRQIALEAPAGAADRAPVGWAERTRAQLALITGVPLALAPADAGRDTGAVVELSGALRRCTVGLSRAAQALHVPEDPPAGGSPVQDVARQVCFDAVGSDLTVTLAAERGTTAGTAFDPVIAFRVLSTLQRLTGTCALLRERAGSSLPAELTPASIIGTLPHV